MRKLLPFFFLLLVLAACRKEYYPSEDFKSRPAYTYSGKQVRDYFNLLCDISKSTPGFFPPQVARAYGYVGIANYEAIVNGIPGAQSLAGQISGLTVSALPQIDLDLQYDWSIASNASIAATIRKMFERNITAVNSRAVDSTEQANLSAMSASINPDVVSRSVQYGKAVAAAIYQYSLNDGGDLSYLEPFQLPFSMPPDPWCWVPTGAVLTPVSPKWGNNRAFIRASVEGLDKYKPKTFSTSSSSSFYAEALEVYEQVKNNTPEQKEIAKYWSDDPFATCTPTGHTFNILTQLLGENKATLEKTSVAYAKLCIAENDAFIACWKGKFSSMLIRPVSYIKQHIDPTFNTVIGTPAFPSYTSGHSAEIGAGAQIFIDMFTNGNGEYKFTDYSQLRYGFSARSYTSFQQMAQECADSRFYGGIHFKMDNTAGLEMGKAVGDNVNKMINWPKNIR